ncbi:MAG: hypothetical protein AB7J30_08020 [Hyphomicrobium sp.]
MSPPAIGSEIEVRRSGKITRYNNDNTVNVKLNQGPGRPHKVRFTDVLHPTPAPSRDPPSNSTALPALVPLPASPPQESHKERTRKGGRLLSIGTIVAVIGMVGAGIFHGMGVQLWNALWSALTGMQAIGH